MSHPVPSLWLARRFHSKYLVFGLVLLSLSLCCGADDTADRPTAAQLKTWKVSALRAELAKRGLDCAGCVEKRHLATRVADTWDAPLVVDDDKDDKDGNDDGQDDPAGPDPDKMERVYEALRKQGIDTTNLRQRSREQQQLDDLVRNMAAKHGGSDKDEL